MSLPILHLSLHGQTIARLIQLAGDRSLLVFDQDYIDNPDRATLSLSFQSKTGGIIHQIKPTQTRLIPFLSNLLPEGAMRHYLAQQAGIKPEREFYLLWALGQDLSGAISVWSEAELPWQPAKSFSSLSTPASISQQLMRFSLAGVQMKFSALPTGRGGLTIPAEGVGGSWIVKLPDTRFKGVPENEFAFMRLAKQLGIPVPEIDLLALDQIAGLPTSLQNLGEHALVIRRFDRNTHGKAIHIEDFAQVFSVYPERKYEAANYRSLAGLIWDLLGETGLSDFIRRLTFSILIGNGDMHLKNWSLIYPDGRTPKLAPAYDFLSTLPYIREESLALKFVDSKFFNQINHASFQRFAQKAQLPERLVLNAVDELLSLFSQRWLVREEWGLYTEVETALELHLKRLPLWVEQ